VGIINLMPRLQEYEPRLLTPLAQATQESGEFDLEPVFIRLESHGYRSSDPDHLARFYRTFSQALGGAPLDGLILTGAPVEEIPFSEVRYWSELVAILEHARLHLRSSLGLCWGAMAMGGLLGVEKRLFPVKLFGVFEDSCLPDSTWFLHPGRPFLCAHSRHSGLREESLLEASGAGAIRLLSRGRETGFSIFETPDHRLVAHQGHPEYSAERLVFEWERDRMLGRADVLPPARFDPENPQTTWRDHQRSFFLGWLSYLLGPPRPQG
jgi:homoserine O-succinyltransferase